MVAGGRAAVVKSSGERRPAINLGFSLLYAIAFLVVGGEGGREGGGEGDHGSERKRRGLV